MPGYRTRHSLRRFMFLLQTSVYDQEGISYRLPDAVHAESSTPW